MKVNWGALGITIGLILVAVSILAMGLMAWGFTNRFARLEEEIPTIRRDTKRFIIAQEYTFSKAESEKRAISLEDLEEGYALAKKFMGE